MSTGARLTIFIALVFIFVITSECRTTPSPQFSSLSLAPASDDALPGSGLKVTYFGTSTILFDDGETAFITDAFFSRPSLRKIRRITPNHAVIRASLERAGISSLAAVIPVHSHYDHVMDAPYVAGVTGAVFMGSASAANVARGHMLPEDRIRVVKDGAVLRLGRFKLTFVQSHHSPGDLVPGRILKPLSTPFRVQDYKTGDCFSLLVEHDNRTILVHASAGFIPGALANHQAEVVFLGIGRLGKTTEDYRHAYWQEVVEAVDARRVIPIHWDNFFRPLSKPLEPLPRFIDSFGTSIDFLLRRAGEANVDLRLPTSWDVIDPFAGLTADQTMSFENP